MGVCIEAYSHLTPTDPHEQHESCIDNGHIWVFAYAAHAASFRGATDPDVVFQMGRDDFIGGRCHVKTPESKYYHIGDWSYFGYEAWRERLCLTINGYPPEHQWNNKDTCRNDPFFELVTFADNEGCIGPLAAADLLADFRNHASAIGHMENCGDWLRGLELAVDGGVVTFS